MSLNGKVAVIVGILFVACCVVAFEGLTGLSDAQDRLNEIVEKVAVRRSHWVELRELQRLLTIREHEFITEKTEEGRRRVEQELNDSKAKLASELQAFLKISTNRGQDAAAEYSKLMVGWWKLHLKVRESMWQGKVDEALAIAAGEGRQARNEAEKLINEMIEINNKAMQEAHVQAAEEYRTTRGLMALTAAGALVMGLILSWLMMRQINRSMGHVIRGLEGTTHHLGSTSQQLAGASLSLSRSATDQAASLGTTASAIEELTSMVQRNLEAAQRTAQLSGSSQSAAQKGKSVVQDMTRAIAEINDSNQQIMKQVEDSNRQIADITKVIAGIGQKTEVINDIVFQTRLLAFNASVEAARAGQHGKGFAVVAEEVGNLAQMSGNAAKDINKMLDESIKKVQGIADQTRTQVEKLIHVGRQKVEVGTKIAKDCEVVLEEIVGGVMEVSQMSLGISSASEEQAQGVREISKAMSVLDQVTHKNSAGAEQAARSAEELKAQARTLEQAVGSLIQTVHGSERQAS